MYRLKQITLLIGDLSSLYLGLYFGLALRNLAWPGQELLVLIKPLSLLFGLAVIIIFIVGLYDVGRAKNSRIFYQKIIAAMLGWLFLSVLFFYATPSPSATPKTILLFTALSGFGIIALWRWFYNKFLSATLWRTTIIFAGVTPEVIELCRVIGREKERGFTVTGLIAPSSINLEPELSSLPVAQSFEELNKKFGVNFAELIILAPALAADSILAKDLYRALFNQSSVLSLAQFYEEFFKRVPPFIFSESWFAANLREQQKKIYDRFRILADYAAALLLCVIFVFTFPIIAALIKLTSNGPVFFKQTRVGRGGRPFIIYKYRTMKVLSGDGSAEVNGPQFAEIADHRVTGIGKFLRRTRLDEFPQFINILKGEMAIIGPRPERPEFAAALTDRLPFYALRHLIKPGLTGWAQIHESYYGTIKENLYKLEYDLYYVKNRGPFLDLAIILRTINILLRMIGR